MFLALDGIKLHDVNTAFTKVTLLSYLYGKNNGCQQSTHSASTLHMLVYLRWGGYGGGETDGRIIKENQP